MKEFLQTVVISLVQGLTEFLPVSSSGHIVILKKIFNIETTNLFFETVLHLGTIFSILVFFRKKILNLIKDSFFEIKEKKMEKKNLRFIILVLIGIIPAGMVGFIFNDMIEKVFENILFVGIFYLLLSFVLFMTKFSKPEEREISLKDSLIIGFSQIFALLPGISRSGLTISTGLYLGLKNEKSFDFSFFMAIPLILGAFFKELIEVKPSFDFNIITGIFFSFLSGYIALIFIYKRFKNRKLHIFSIYTFILGIFILLWSMK